MNNFFKNIFLLLIVIIVSGCSTIITSRKQKENILNHYKNGDYNTTSSLLGDYLKRRKDTGDELMWLLEEGSLMFELKKFKGSLQAFEKAEKLINNYENRAVVNLRHVGAESGSLLTNPNAIPYYGYFYDKILLNTYKALDYFAMSKPDAARVELRRAYEKQKDAKRYFEIELKNRIKEYEVPKDRNASMPKVSSVMRNKQIRNEYAKMLRYAENKKYGGFINPFTTYLLAIAYLTEGNYEEACLDLKELYAIDPSNEQIQKDYIKCLKKTGRSVPWRLNNVRTKDYPLDKNIIYIVYASGLAPALKENKFQLVLPRIGYTGFAYPSIEYFKQSVPEIRVADDKGNIHGLYKITDMNTIISQEFKEYFYSRVSRIAASVLTKEAATIAALKAAEKTENPQWAILSILITSSLYKAVFNTADTRSWQLLPNEFYIANLPMPEDGKLKILVDNHRDNEIELDKTKGDKAIVFIRAVNKSKISTIICQFF